MYPDMAVNVMLAGVGFFPHTVAGDKNFWIRMAPLLQERGARLVALSVNDRTGVSDFADGLKLFNLRRSFHLGNPKRFYSSQGGALDYKHKHHRAIDSLELLLTAARNLGFIKRVIKSEDVRVVHFMDNMGPAMRFLKRRIPGARFTNSQVRYNGGRMYESYIRSSMLGLDRTVAYSESCRRQLIDAGIPAEAVTVIRWGVRPPDSAPDPKIVASVRQRLGAQPGQSLVVWSGFIMHIQRPDFEAAVAAARKIAEKRPDCRFVFSFKPMCFSPEFKRFEAERVSVYGDLEDFQDVLAAADFFLSPSVRPGADVSPPLTWIEAMSYGTPLIVTDGPSVSEVIGNGKTGYTARSMEDLPAAVDAALDAPDRAAVRQKCRDVVREKFNVEKSADHYVTLWSSLAE
ncbi:MAG: glycosyltransferase family 4 protein [Armatimonadota bacterium]|nr:glycosyltransferase family 4 protein [Armatimonadota bacterium]